MHPAIKIVNLIVISIFLTQGSWFSILLAGALLLPFYIIRPDLWRPAIKMLFRLKWFFISILLIYYYYTPDIQQSAQTIISQISERILPGSFRITVLIFILLTVNLFIRTTSKEEILSALLWLFLPLKFFNINIERIALRAILTLEYIEILSGRLAQYKDNRTLDTLVNASVPDSFYAKKKGVLLHLVKSSGIILREILEEADTTSGKSYSIDCLKSPAIIQYLLPVLLCLLFLLTL